VLPHHPLPTTVIGSYPQPEWLIDHLALLKDVPRVRARELWRIPADLLGPAQDDATILAVRDMERAGIDIISDGEMRRESYSNYFATALKGIDSQDPATITTVAGQTVRVPRVVGPIGRRNAIGRHDLEFLRTVTERPIKVTIPGPFTMAQQAHNEYYPDIETTAMAFAEAVNAEARDLEAAGADVIQLDEPWLRNDPEAAKVFAVQVIDRALEGLTVATAVHLCFGYAAVTHGQKPTGYSFLVQLADSCVRQISIEASQPKLDLGMLTELSGKEIMLGVIDLADASIETPETVAGRIRAGLRYVAPERLIPAPDCGMKYLSRATAFGKLEALSEGAGIVRRELVG
jgi:5-methyltetrahydropteroyltriglutamate--homocysteine methyltransferase